MRVIKRFCLIAGLSAGIVLGNSFSASAEILRIGQVGYNLSYPGQPVFQLSSAPLFQSYGISNDLFFSFDALSVSKTVASLSCIYSYGGSYDAGTMRMTLEVHDFSGKVLRTLTRTYVDLETVPYSVWASIPLVTSSTQRTVKPGEMLVLHMSRVGGPSGDLDVSSACQAITN